MGSSILGSPQKHPNKTHIPQHSNLNQAVAPVIFDQNSSRNMEYTKTRRPPINRMILNERSPCKSRVNLKTCEVGGTPQDQPPRLVSSPRKRHRSWCLQDSYPSVRATTSEVGEIQYQLRPGRNHHQYLGERIPVRNFRRPARRTGRFRKIAAWEVKQTSSNIQEIHKVRWRSTAGVCSKYSKFFRMNRKCSWDTSNHPQNHSAWAVPK